MVARLSSNATRLYDTMSTSLDNILFPILLPLGLLSLSLLVGAIQVAESSIRKIKRTNRSRRKKLLAEIGIDEKKELADGGHSRTILGLFHPYCNAGGGGERVLFEAIAFHQQQDPSLVTVVYTGDYPTASKQEILSKAEQRFGIRVQPETVILVGLTRRHLVEDSYWRRLTMLGQSYGSIVLAFEAMASLIPDIYIDTMGYAFTYPIVRIFSKKAPIGAYVHYPTISTDMLRRVENRQPGHTNDEKVTKSLTRSKAKLYYYRIFAWLYSWALCRANQLVVNGTWTRNHINSLIGSKTNHSNDQIRRAEIVYPPCDTRSMNSFPLERRNRWIVSLAQFRPEKEHSQQLRILRALFDLRPDLLRTPEQGGHVDGPVKMIMMGSSRNPDDEERIKKLQNMVVELQLTDHVEIVVNASFDKVLVYLQQASIGLSTMVDEHFGINVVEFMAAGLVTLSHASAGPLMDIAVPVNGQRTGYHATDTNSFTQTLSDIFDLDELLLLAIRKRARSRAVETFGTEGFRQSWLERLWNPLINRIDSLKEKKIV